MLGLGLLFVAQLNAGSVAWCQTWPNSGHFEPASCNIWRYYFRSQTVNDMLQKTVELRYTTDKFKNDLISEAKEPIIKLKRQCNFLKM